MFIPSGSRTDDAARHAQVPSGLLEARSLAVEGIARGQTKNEVLAGIAVALEHEVAHTQIAILTVDPEGAYLHCAAAPSLPSGYVENLTAVPIAPDVGCSGAAAWHATRVASTERANPPDPSGQSRQRQYAGTREWAQPVFGVDGRVVAVLKGYTPATQDPAREDIAYVERACELVGMVIDQLSRIDRAWPQRPDDAPDLDTVPVGVFRMSVQTDSITYANETLAGTLGYPTSHDFIQQTRPSQIYADPAQRHAVQGRAARDGTAIGQEVYLRRRDGGTIIGLLDMRAVYAADRTLAAFEGVVRDVTDHKQREQRFFRSYELYRHIFEYGPLGAMVIDRAHTVVLANYAVEQIFGYESNEMIGTPLEALVPHLAQRHGLFDQPANDSENATPIDNGSLEVNGFTRDGHTVPLQVSAQPLNHVRDGQLLISVQDISRRHEALKAMQDTEEKFRQVFERAGIGIALFDVNKYLIASNPALEKMLGYAENELFHIYFADITHQDDLDICETRMGHLVEGFAESDTFEKRYITKTNSVIDASVTASIVRSEQGEPWYFIVLIEDITQEKRMYRELYESRERFRRIFEDADIGIATVDLEGYIRDVNPKLQDMLGYGRNALCGLHVGDVTFEEDRQKDLEQFALLRRGDQDAYRIDKRYVCREGSVIWGKLTVSLVRDAHGEPSYGFGLVEDITDQKQAEQALREREREARELFENTAVGLFRTTKDDSFARVNGAFAEMMGFAHPQDLIDNLRPTDVYHDPNQRWEIRQRVDRFGYIDNEVVLLKKKDGTTIWVLLDSHAVYNDENAIVYYEGAIQDITERKKLEDRLRTARDEAQRANHAKTAFLANMSHDLRTPLNAILGMSEIIRDRILGDDVKSYVDYAKDINQSGQYLKNLVEDLLELTQLESGNYQIRANWIDTASTIRQCKRMVAQRRDAAGVTFTVSTDAPPILGDERALRQILTNLLVNAVKYAGQGATIELDTRRRADGGLDIVVCDDGPGMDSGDLERIVQPFERGNQTHAAKTQEGSGLGLAICQNFMRLHDGRLEVASSPGQGTSVAAVFPADRVAWETTSQPPKE